MSASATPYRFITVESHDDGMIAEIVLNREERRNAQNRGLLVELDDALRKAEADDAVRVIVLGANGPVFSAGHDIGSPEHLQERLPGPNQHPTRQIDGGTRLATEQRILQEWHYYFQNTLRWRNLRKITIARVHGSVLAAGLMLAWACDLIVAAEGTVFADVVGTRLGMCGLEYFAHPWEFGPRKAKELLLTGDALDADEALRLGMVSKVFPKETLNADALALARRIARLPSVTSLLIKESVNQTMDNMGFFNALNACFNLHQVNHAYWAEVSNGAQQLGSAEYGLPDWRTAPQAAVASPHHP
jgi:enoyl-CoA hydratase